MFLFFSKFFLEFGVNDHIGQRINICLSTFSIKEKKILTVSAVLLVTNAENETFFGCSSFLLIILGLLQGIYILFTVRSDDISVQQLLQSDSHNIYFRIKDTIYPQHMSNPIPREPRGKGSLYCIDAAHASPSV